MPRTLVTALAALLLPLPVAPLAAEEPPATEIEVRDNTYAPSPITVPVGTVVTWRQTGNNPHTVTADDGSFDSHPNCMPVCMTAGQTFTVTLDEPGTVRYFCKVHGSPGGGGMSGTILVMDEETGVPTSIDSLSTSSDGTSLSVSGSATFRGEEPVLVAEDFPGDGPIAPDQASETGVDLLGGYIYQPDPDDPTLVLEWRVTGLPETGSLPEVVRYGFPAKTAASDYQFQAKFSNLASSTLPDDPPGHVTHADGRSFQLRGDCGPHPTVPNLTHCRHIAWLDGEFDTEADAVRLRVPIGSSFAPDIVPGAELIRNDAAFGGDVVATYQAVASVDATEDAAYWDPADAYTVPERTVRLGLVPVGAPASYMASAAVGEDGSSFEGALDVSGVTGEWDLVAEACFGTNCGQARITIAL